MQNRNKTIQISCDGGAATGKSTGAKMLAKKYKLKFLSSGLLYRYASFLIIKHKPKNIISFLKVKSIANPEPKIVLFMFGLFFKE